MTPVEFPEANARFHAPADLAESQCLTISAYHGVVRGGSVDGSPLVVTCWQPTPEELARLNAGGPIYLSFIGGLPPHFVTVSFEEATHPA